MTTQLFPVYMYAKSESSIGNTSSQWSVSTTSNAPQGDPQSLVKEDGENLKTECFPVLKLFQLLFRLKKHSKVVDNARILKEISEHTNLVICFLEGCTKKFKFFTDKICFPEAHTFTIQEKDTMLLPTAHIWAAAYLMKLCLQPEQTDLPNENFIEVNSNKSGRVVINSSSFRPLLLLLYWEMEVTKRVAQEFYIRFVKFSGDINNAFKKLRTILLATSKTKAIWLSLFKIVDIKDTNFYEKLNLDMKSKRDKGPLFLEVAPKTQQEYPFSLSIDVTNEDDHVVTKNQDFSRMEHNKREEIITGLLKSVNDFVENCHFLLEASVKQICSRGIVKKGLNGNKDITCYSSFNSIKYLTAELLSNKNYLQPNETEVKILHNCLAALLKRWVEYEENAKWALLKFFELCDMITICYQFSLYHTKLNVPEIGVIQNEVNTKSKFQKCEKCRSKQKKIKHCAIGSIIAECDSKADRDVSTTNVLGSQGESAGNFYHQLMTSTRYHLAIQQYPLELKNGCSKCTVVLRPIPDLETVNSDMILFDQVYDIKITNEPNLFNFELEKLELKTF